MEIKSRVEKLERAAARTGRQLIAIVDPIDQYISLGSAGREWESVNHEELAALRERLGDNLLVVRITDEQPQAAN